MVRPLDRNDDYFVCAHCGAELACASTVCRECGASEDSGWSDGEVASTEEDEDDFDYDDFLRREFPSHAAAPRWGSPKTWLTAIIVLLLCLALLTIW